MRILVLTPTFLPALGGAELVILQVYRRLAARHRIRVLTPYLSEKVLNASYSDEYSNKINFEVEHYRDILSFMRIRGHRISFGLIPPFSLSAVNAIRRTSESFKPDVINVHYVMPTGLAGLYAQKILNIPTVLTYNGRDVSGPGVPALWKYWHILVGRNCKDMTFVSNYCRNVIYGPEFKSGNIIYNGAEPPLPVDREKVNHLREKLSIGKNTKVLFALQRLDYLKRVDVIIRSMEKIVKIRPETRLIIGGKGADLNRLKMLVQESKIGDKILFAGFISDSELPLYYAIADLFVFHSTYETFGLVLAEAMNYRKAVVSVENTAIQEVVENGKTGVLVPTSDHKALANAVLRLLDDEKLRNEMGIQGYKKAQKYFKWDAIAVQYEKILKSAIVDKPS